MSASAAPQNSFQAALEPAKRFAQDSFRLVKRCTKPDAKEFKKIALATTVGFLVMGFLGFFVKLVHIPSQNNTQHTQRTHNAMRNRARQTMETERNTRKQTRNGDRTGGRVTRHNEWSHLASKSLTSLRRCCALRILCFAFLCCALLQSTTSSLDSKQRALPKPRTSI